MIFSSAILFFCWLLSMGCIGAGWVFAYRLAPEPRRSAHLRWLVGWSVKGLVVPFLLWVLMNVGLSWSLPAFMPGIQAAQNSGRGWHLEFLAVAAAGLFLISSYWAATTTGWALARSHAWMETEVREDFKSLCRTWLLGMCLPALAVAWVGGGWTLGLAVLVLLAPIAGNTPSLIIPHKLPPMYARAIARLKFGKYDEAEQEIIRELEKKEDDFEGWFMLADLYANHFHDLTAAEQTVLDICDHPKTTPPQLSIALHRLADWYLKLGNDPDAARRALQVICHRLPGTHLARMAQLRLQQLPATVEALREAQANKPIPLPALGNHLDEAPAEPPSAAARAEAAAQARACVEHLQRDPNHLPTREQLARLLAEQLARPDDGIGQLLQLLSVPDQPPGKRAEWWSLIAAWHLKYRRDPAAGRQVLERILREFPETPQALAARRRLELLDAPSAS